MPRHIAPIAVALWFVVVVSTVASQTTTTSSAQEIDRDIWSVFVATVAADDIVGMGRAYFPDAVLVSPKGTRPIKDTLEGWGRDMVAAKARGDKAKEVADLVSTTDGIIFHLWSHDDKVPSGSVIIAQSVGHVDLTAAQLKQGAPAAPATNPPKD